MLLVERRRRFEPSVRRGGPYNDPRDREVRVRARLTAALGEEQQRRRERWFPCGRAPSASEIVRPAGCCFSPAARIGSQPRSCRPRCPPVGLGTRPHASRMEEPRCDSQTPEEGPCPSCCSMPPAAVAHPPPCRNSTPAGRRATRGSATRPIRPRSRRSSRSCAPPATASTAKRLRGLIVVLWRAGLRICEALALTEADLDPRRGSLLVRRGKGGRRREVGMDDWAWEQLAPWLDVRVELPVGPLFCVVNGPTRGRPWSAAAARTK